jgi:YgiT-type zinc finger domain-containing protein
MILEKGNNKMECLYCKGNMVYTTAPFSVNRKGYHITWDTIPAWVCTQCGEPLFEEKEVTHIQNALRKLDEEMAHLQLKSA